MLHWGMALHIFDSSIAGAPSEPFLLGEVTVRLIKDSERERFDEELVSKHYLKNANAVGRVLRYVAEYCGQWVALVMFNSAAYHLKPRDQWLHWVGTQVAQRRHLIAQNSRFLVLAARSKWPNLASRVLKLTCARLSVDWREHFGYPVLAVETFVDPQRELRQPLHELLNTILGRVYATLSLALFATVRYATPDRSRIDSQRVLLYSC